jgi:hypothetical protein
MVLKSVFAAATCAILLATGGVARADDYRPGQYLNMDLSRAVLSPTRFGPPAEFAPVPVEARTDARQVATERVVTTPKLRVVQPRVEKPRPAVRSKLAQRRSNPLDANAMDRRSRVQTSVQTWPCKSGGICNWKR